MTAIANLVHQQTTTPGTGPYTLSSVSGRQPFDNAFGHGATTNVFYVFMSHQSAAQYMWAKAHLSAANTLVIDTVLGGSNGTSAVNFSAGTIDVTNALPADTINGLTIDDEITGTPGTIVAHAQGSSSKLYLNIRAKGAYVPVTIGANLYPNPYNDYQRYDTDSIIAANSIGCRNIAVGYASAIGPGTNSWCNTLEPGTDSSLVNSVYSISPTGRAAGLFAARTSDLPAAGEATCVQLIVSSDNALNACLEQGLMISGYVSASAASGFNHTNSINYIANSAASVGADPYNITPSGSVWNQQYASGNGGFVASPNNLTGAIAVINNTGKFNSGIVFQSTALDTSVNANPDALALPYSYSISWYNAAAAKTWQIYSSSGANGNLNITSPGTGAVTAFNNIQSFQNKNGAASLAVNNQNNGSSAIAGIYLTSNAGTFSTSVGSNAAGGASQFLWNGAGPMLFDAQNAAGSITFRTGTTPTQAMKIFTSGGISIGASAGDPGINNLKLQGSLALAAPVTLTGTSGTVGASDSAVIINASGTFTLTLPAAATYPGRILNIKSVAAQTVNSASSNVVPIGSTTAGTAILTNTAGKWTRLHSDGTNWVTMEAN